MRFGFNEFIIAAGYKYSIIRDYFKNNQIHAKINVVNTGVETLT